MRFAKVGEGPERGNAAPYQRVEIKNPLESQI